MDWLWMISVGVTDVQFPVWSKDDYGQWSRLQRFETGRAGIRAVHEGLLGLLRNGQIRFDDTLPRPIDRGVARDLRLEFMQEDNAFVAAIRHPDYRISSEGDTIPNAREKQLPLYCPKVHALLPSAREAFGRDRVTVLVLNTRRAEAFSESAAEPVASGPLVAKYLSERLGLTWVDGQGGVPEALAPGTATWLDILTGEEAVEDGAAQERVVARLNAAIRAWSPGSSAGGRVAVTTSGGVPPLKPLIERVPATCFGQGQVLLLDQPERGPTLSQPLRYDTRVSEREVLRFQCAEALRTGDYAGAYGLASRASGGAWAREVVDGLGPLLEFSGARVRPQVINLAPFALGACRVEVRLCMGDVIGALMRLGAFVETVSWELIARDARLRGLGLVVDRDDECLVGNLPDDHALFARQLLDRDSRGQDHHRVLGISWSWPVWLKHRSGGQWATAQALYELADRYGGEPRRLRNRLMHGSDDPVLPEGVKDSLLQSGLIAGVALAFGQNFLAVAPVKGLLAGLGAAGLPATVGGHLKGVLDRVIEG